MIYPRIRLISALVSFCILAGAVPALSATPDCASRLTPATEAKVRKHMLAEGLIRDGDEVELPEIGVRTRWTLRRLVPAVGESCMAIMAICQHVAGQVTCDTEFDVIGLQLAPLASQDKVIPFEKLYTIPKKLIATIGGRPGSGLDFSSYYYVELTGSSAIAAAKTWLAKAPYGGFSGLAVLGGKAPFDPTQGRNWKIVQAQFDLRRGSSAEALSINSEHFDGPEAASYWKSCIRAPDWKYGKCQVAPWEQSFIIGLKPAGP
jgi:hypothetical protein